MAEPLTKAEVEALLNGVVRNDEYDGWITKLLNTALALFSQHEAAGARIAELERDNAILEKFSAPKLMYELQARAEAAEAQAARLREALTPFADEAAHYDPDEGDGASVAWNSDFTIGSLRRARAALGEAS